MKNSSLPKAAARFLSCFYSEGFLQYISVLHGEYNIKNHDRVGMRCCPGDPFE